MANFFKKLLGLDDTLSEQERLIKDIFTKLMDMPNTDKILVSSTCAYLSNNEMHVCAALDGNDVIIENDKETLSLRCQSKFILMLSELVSSTLERNITNLYGRMYERQTKTLEGIDTLLTLKEEEPDTNAGDQSISDYEKNIS